VNENNKYNILWELITAQNGAGLSDTPETPMTDTPHKNPESCTESDTPETDAVLKQFEHHLPNWLASEIMAAVARRLERERDEAYAALISLRNSYGGQLADYADDECKCTDCQVLRKIDAVLKKHEL
jgi:hypothetical protein